MRVSLLTARVWLPETKDNKCAASGFGLLGFHWQWRSAQGSHTCSGGNTGSYDSSMLPTSLFSSDLSEVTFVMGA